MFKSCKELLVKAVIFKCFKFIKVLPKKHVIFKLILNYSNIKKMFNKLSFI